jgi:hypothetical protein
MAQEFFTTASIGTWDKPEFVREVIVECWGGGGGGGTTPNSNNSGGGGGAGGQYSIKVLQYSSAASQITYSVGTGGAGQTVGGARSDGGDSIWDSNQVVAKGGVGANIGTPGTGSIAGGVGDNVYRGGSGGTAPAGNSGAGGGGAGSTGNGGDASTSTAGTGTSELGGNGGAGQATNNTAGNPGFIYGGAGSGGRRLNANQVGGAGAAGYIRITYDIVPPYRSYGYLID